MKKTFEQILKEEKITIPRTSFYAERVKRYNSTLSEDFELDEESITILKRELPFDKICKPTLKKMAENLILLNRQYHRKTDENRLELMLQPSYHGYRDSSFYYTKD